MSGRPQEGSSILSASVDGELMLNPGSGSSSLLSAVDLTLIHSFHSPNSVGMSADAISFHLACTSSLTFCSATSLSRLISSLRLGEHRFSFNWRFSLGPDGLQSFRYYDCYALVGCKQGLRSVNESLAALSPWMHTRNWQPPRSAHPILHNFATPKPEKPSESPLELIMPLPLRETNVSCRS